MGRWKKDLLCIGLLAITGTILYANTLFNDFVYDDLVTVEENLFIRDWKNIRQFFTGDYYLLSEEYSFRPLVTLTYFLDYFCWENQPRGYHLTNLLIHLVTGIVAYLLALHLFGKRIPALFSALFFVVHPAQTEAVAGISFREDILCAIFYYLAVILYIKSYRKTGGIGWLTCLLSLFSFVLALLAKEMAVTLPLILVAYEMIIRRRKLKVIFQPQILVFFVIAFFYALARYLILYQRESLPGTPEFGNILTRLFLASKGLGLYGRLAFLPFHLTVEYPDPFPPVVWSTYLLFPSLLTIALLLAVWIKGKNQPVARFGLAFFVIGLLPVLNLVPSARLGAERFLYLPLLGFCLGGGATVASISKSGGKTGKGKNVFFLVGLILLFWAAGTVWQNRVWRNNLTLFSRAVEVSPLSSKAHHGLGNEYFRMGEIAQESGRRDEAWTYFNDAIRELEEAISIFARDPMYYNSLGIVYGEMGRILDYQGNHRNALEYFERALAEFKASIRRGRGDPMLVSVNLSNLYLLMGKIPQAIEEIEKYIAARPLDPKGCLILGEIYLNQQNYPRAIEAYQKALLLNPHSPLALSSLGYCYYQLGDYQSAKQFWEKALSLDTGNPELKHYLEILSKIKS